MSTPLSRREILFGLTATGVLGTGMEAAAQRTHPPDPGAPAQDEQLGQVLRLMMNANRRFMNLQARWTDPPDPNMPQIVALLDSIKAECDGIDQIADALLATLER